ncbi:PQQ-binding-like beta-propeller repeat protein [Actinomadura sp. 9N407]|uniref:protein kinase domain-containing protein n=1 Tax=Actinomadura sp. 9N407 TaxID=3375154 RepID=UPI00379BE8B6
MEPLQAEDPEGVGPYQLLARLGAGGMGKVFLGRSPSGRMVAVKVVHAELAGDTDFRARFRREITAAGSVSGAFTAAVVDADPEAPNPWLVTEFLPGMSLEAAVARHGPLPPAAVTALAASLAEGLTAVHRAGVVHRDLKPSNVMLTPEGPRVIDFGIARPTDASAITQSGMAVGSPGYMAPEQAAMQQSGPPGDVFSMAAVLVFAATGAGPFGTGPMHAMIYRIMHEAPRLAGVADAELGRMLAACLDKDPARRPALDQILRWLVARLPEHTAPHGVTWLPPSVAEDIGTHSTQVPQGPLRTAPVPGTHGTQAARKPVKRRRVLMAGLAVAGVGIAGAGTAGAAWLLNGDDAMGDAEELWTFEVPGEVSQGPVLGDGVVVMASGSPRTLYGLDAKTGKERWKTPFAPSITAIRNIADGLVYVSAMSGSIQLLYAFDLKTGKERWNLPFDAPLGVPVVTGSGSVFVGGVDTRTMKPVVMSADVATGRPQRTYETSTKIFPSPAHAEGTLYIAAGLDLTAYNATTGARVWTYKSQDRFTGMPVVGRSAVYVSSEQGLHALDPGNGKRLWAVANPSPKGTTNGWVPTALGPLVLCPGPGDVVLQLEGGTGRKMSSLSLGGGLSARGRDGADLYRPVMAGAGAVIFNGVDQLYGMAIGSGQASWQKPVKGATGLVPVKAGGRVHLATETGVLSYDAHTGKVVHEITGMKVRDLVTDDDVLYFAAGPTTATKPTTIRAVRPPSTVDS